MPGSCASHGWFVRFPRLVGGPPTLARALPMEGWRASCPWFVPFRMDDPCPPDDGWCPSYAWLTRLLGSVRAPPMHGSLATKHGLYDNHAWEARSPRSFTGLLREHLW